MSDTFEAPPRSALGACWDVPEGRLTATLHQRFPIERVATWSVRPHEPEWGRCRCTLEDANVVHEDPLAADGCVTKALAADHLAGATLPPITIIHRPDQPDDDHGPWLVDDGMHRISMCLLLGLTTWPAWVFATPGPTGI